MSEKVKYGAAQVSTLSKGVRNLLHQVFDAKQIKESVAGFRIVGKELDATQIEYLGRMQLYNAKVHVKRSGLGLTIFIS